MTIGINRTTSRRPRTLLILCAVALIGTLTGCTKQAIKKAVQERLADPDSAKFGAIDFIGNYACVQVDAKSEMGGYVGMSSELAKKSPNGKWEIFFIDESSQEQCLDFAKRKSPIEK